MSRHLTLLPISDSDRARRSQDNRPLHPTADQWVILDGLTAGYTVPTRSGWSLHALDGMCIAEGPLDLPGVHRQAADLLPATSTLPPTPATASTPTSHDQTPHVNAQPRRRPFRFVAALQPLVITTVVSVLLSKWLSGHPKPAVSASDGERNMWALVDTLHNIAGAALKFVAPMTVFWLALRALRWSFNPGPSTPASAKPSLIDDDVVAVEDDGTDGVTALYAEAVAAVTAVRLAWFDYEADPVLAFKYPQIHDVTHSDTADFIEALAGCPSFEVYPGDMRAVEWVAAADRLIAAWEMCETSAKATGLNAIPASERAVIELAIRMLTKGLDEAATPAERSTFVRRAYELVTPIIANQDVRFVLPSETVAALNVAIRGELTATASAGKVLASPGSRPVGDSTPA